MDVEVAKEHLRVHKLAAIEDDLERLAYLAHKRDPTSGKYSLHELATVFSEPVSDLALAECHQEVFHRLAVSSFESFVAQVDRYIRSATADPQSNTCFRTRPEAYAALIPPCCHSLAALVFESNVRLALRFIESRPSLCSNEG